MNEDALEALKNMSAGTGNANSRHRYGAEKNRRMLFARNELARVLGGQKEEYFFTSGATEANFLLHKLFPDHTALTSIAEHKSNLIDYERKFSVNQFGQIITDRLFNCIDQLSKEEEKVLVSLIWVNNETGAINPIREIGAYCKDKPNVIFHVDATQAVGHVPINVEEDHIDAMSFSAHKFGGPQGIGCLYLSDRVPTDVMDQSILHYLKDPKTVSVAGIYSMGVAIRKATNDILLNLYDLRSKRDYFLYHLRKLGVGFKVNGDGYPGIISLTVPGTNGDTLMMELDNEGFMVSVGAACSSGDDYSLRVLQGMGLTEDEARCTIRISIGDGITYQDMELLAKKIVESIEKIKERIADAED